jgi:feruloyl esterase
MQDSLNELNLLYPFRWLYGANFDPMKFDFDKDMDHFNAMLGPVLNANDPNLMPFKTKGGKMLMYFGSSDPLIPYEDAVHYYDRVIDRMGGLENVQDFFRFFVVPGLWHNNGGPGPCNIGQRISDASQSSDINVFNALIRWVEQGVAPEKIIGSTWDAPLRMPVYPYPKFPQLIPGREPGIPDSYQPVVRERGKVVAPAPKYLK